jgi:uncharacterized protein
MLDLSAQPLIGMLHAPPLAGSPRFGGDLAAVRNAVLADAEALFSTGFSALLLENYGDSPFFPGRVPPVTVAHLAALARDVAAQHPSVALGVNVLRNDGQAALAIAASCGLSFIRVNVLCGARVADQGLIQGIAHDLLRERRALGADEVRILADVDVKHSAPLAARPLEEEVADLVRRGGADAVVVTGVATGIGASREKLARVKAAAGDCPVLVGSGVSPGNLAELLAVADGAIVGSSLKAGGLAENRVDAGRAAALIAVRRRIRAS